MTEQPQVRRDLCPGDDGLVELALGQAPRDTGERLARHLATCTACRRSYDELAGAVELVLPAVPRIAPPPAFEANALARIERARRGAAQAGPVPALRRRTVLWAAAAAVLGTAAGAGVTAYLSQDGPPAPWSTPLLTAEGAMVGQVSHSFGESGNLLVIEVTDGPVGRTYTCRLRRRDGSTSDVGVWSLAADRPNSWVVPIGDPADVAAVELVAPGGNVWSSASL